MCWVFSNFSIIIFWISIISVAKSEEIWESNGFWLALGAAFAVAAAEEADTSPSSKTLLADPSTSFLVFSRVFRKKNVELLENLHLNSKFVCYRQLFGNHQWNFENRIVKMRKSLTKFGWNFECWAVQKRVNLVDLVKSFQTSIYLQTLASIQPRTSLSKFANN